MGSRRVRRERYEATVQEITLALQAGRQGLGEDGLDLGEKPKLYVVYLSEETDEVESPSKDGNTSLGKMQVCKPPKTPSSRC